MNARSVGIFSPTLNAHLNHFAMILQELILEQRNFSHEDYTILIKSACFSEYYLSTFFLDRFNAIARVRFKFWRNETEKESQSFLKKAAG